MRSLRRQREPPEARDHNDGPIGFPPPSDHRRFDVVMVATTLVLGVIWLMSTVADL